MKQAMLAAIPGLTIQDCIKFFNAQAAVRIYTKIPVVDRIMVKVTVVGTCWVWRAGEPRGRSQGPYFNFNGETINPARVLFAPNDANPPRVTRTCTNRWCINPDHHQRREPSQ